MKLQQLVSSFSGITLRTLKLFCNFNYDGYINTIIDEFIVMPNHIHGIIVINGNCNHHNVGNSNHDNVGNRHACSLQKNEHIKRNHQLLFTVIGSFKSAVSKIVRKQLFSFQWQRSFYDHIIRSEQSLQKIRQYIQSNPSKWNEDENNSNNVGIRHA